MLPATELNLCQTLKAEDFSSQRGNIFIALTVFWEGVSVQLWLTMWLQPPFFSMQILHLGHWKRKHPFNPQHYTQVRQHNINVNIHFIQYVQQIKTVEHLLFVMYCTNCNTISDKCVYSSTTNYLCSFSIALGSVCVCVLICRFLIHL